MKKRKIQTRDLILEKSATGIKGLDQITFGGLPKGRPTLVCGNAGCGKTLLAMEFLVHGAIQYNEPGVFMSFEETEQELITNVASLDFDLTGLIARQKIVIDHVFVERSEIELTGEYDLEGLFIRLDYAIETIGAKRVVLDTIESLFAGLPNPLVLRAELRRLFRWLKDKGVTTIITGESGDKLLTREGLEEYVSDCVIILDHRIAEQSSTRRLRIAKYRGSSHATNEFPFLIDDKGFSVLPITSIGLAYSVTSERISSGIPKLDEMLGGKGLFRGSSVLVSGTAGSGKSSIAASSTVATCQRGEKVLYFAMEESPAQIMRNMLSIGIDLQTWVDKGLLQFHSIRPTFYGLEMHLTSMLKLMENFKPQTVVVDPINSFGIGSDVFDTKLMLIRLIDYLKLNKLTGFFTTLTSAGTALEHTDIAISSAIDTWLLLRDIEFEGERTRGLYILKSRGMKHSHQIREFLLTDHGIDLLDVYNGPDGFLTGSARTVHEAQEVAGRLLREQEIQSKKLELEVKRTALETKIAMLRAEFENEAAAISTGLALEEERSELNNEERRVLSMSRNSNGAT